MAAIITDQLRILNAKNFVNSVRDSDNSFYSFIGLPNPYDYDSNWNVNPPAPKDNGDEENDYWDTIIAVKKISNDDVRHVVKKILWTRENVYDMYRNDISRTKLTNASSSSSIYASNYYVINEDYRVYICLNNGTDPEHPDGRPSLDQPTFTDLEPKAAGLSGDGYIWKYLYTIKPSEIIKFDSTNYIPVPDNWETNINTAEVRNHAETSGQLKNILIKDRGVGLGTANVIYTNVPIKGDGSGAEASIVIGNDSKVDRIVITNGGSGYTYGIVDYVSGGLPVNTLPPSFEVIIPPKGGHGADIYNELGAFNVMVFSAIENDLENPDFILENQVSRVGIVQNPTVYNSTSILTLDKASSISAIKLTGTGFNDVSFNEDSIIEQTIGSGQTAVARVVSYNKSTGILKYWNDRYTHGVGYGGTISYNPTYGLDRHAFTNVPSGSGSIDIRGNDGNIVLQIDTAFTGSTMQINNRTYNLGQSFVNGLANPEVEKYSGNIIYVDNRPPITRSQNQKELIKVILQF